MILIKRKKDLEKFINKDGYQIFLLIQHFGLVVHSWIVLNKKGDFTRIEVLMHRNLKTQEYIYERKNKIISPLDDLTGKIALIKIVTLNGIYEGEKAKEIILYLENHIENYKFKSIYSPFGPSCNTITQAIINKFPELGFKLPWNAIGKNFAKKNSFYK